MGSPIPVVMSFIFLGLLESGTFYNIFRNNQSSDILMIIINMF